MTETIILERSRFSKWAFFLGWAAVLGFLGWCTPWMGQWAADHLFGSLSAFSEFLFLSKDPLIVGTRICGGILLALAACLIHYRNQVKITLSDGAVTTDCGNQKVRLARTEISYVYLEFGALREIVFAGKDGNELHREFLPNMPTEKIRQAFLNTGYPWADKIPFQEEYVRWEGSHPDLTKIDRQSLNRRKKYLKEGEPYKANNIRKKLAKGGILLMDRGKDQYIRILTSKDEREKDWKNW